MAFVHGTAEGLMWVSYFALTHTKGPVPHPSRRWALSEDRGDIRWAAQLRFPVVEVKFYPNPLPLKKGS